MNQKGFIPVAIILIILGVLVLGGGGYYAVKKWQKSETQACTQEAKQCPDGSYVSRTEPNCEFAKCPEVRIDETAGWKTYRNEKYGFRVKYPKEYIISFDNILGTDIIFFLDKTDPSEFNSRFVIYIKNLSDVSKEPENIVSGPQKISIDNISANVYKIRQTSRFLQNTYDLAVFSKNNKTYSFDDSGSKPDEKIFTQILSTFKFTK